MPSPAERKAQLVIAALFVGVCGTFFATAAGAQNSSPVSSESKIRRSSPLSENARTSEAKSPKLFTSSHLDAMRIQKLNYVLATLITSNARKAWVNCHLKPTGRVLTTKTLLTLDSLGRIKEFKIVSPSGSPGEDEAVKRIVTSMTFPALPATCPNLKLFWTFMSDGSMNLLDHTQSKEADDYNRQVLGTIMGRSLVDIGAPP